ncbi:MAG: hypothetical protein NVS9B14_08310 [Candidatus Acidiferrum sp.]
MRQLQAFVERDFMKILVTGSTGLVGRALVAALVKQGHSVCRLVRPGTDANDEAGGFNVAWNPATGELGGAAVGPDAVVNLAGASIADGRWTDKRKEELRASRVNTTRALIEAIGRMNVKPSVFISASAIGYYGNRGDEALTEESSGGNDFLAGIAKDWEAEALKAEEWKTRVVLARFGIILAKHGGALANMLTPFRLGLGGRLGSGKQWMSWIALEDVLSILKLCLEQTPIRGAVEFAPISGALNIVSPEPVKNGEFAKALAAALHRPAILPAPAFALRVALGAEMANALLLSSQHVMPGKLLAAKYEFQFPTLDAALQKILT